MSEWIECGLPYRTYDGAPSFEETAPQPLAGLLIETEHGQHLIGNINELRGVCDDCTEFGGETVVRRYRIIWRPENLNVTVRG